MEESYLATYIESDTEVDRPFANQEVDHQYRDENDMLKDSLESIEEDLNTIEDEIKPFETIEEVNESNNVIPVHIKVSKDSKPGETQSESEKGRNIGNKKSQSLKPPRRDDIELNKINVSKSRPKGSYSNIYRQRLLNQK